MKALIFGVALCAASLPALAQTNVSVSIGQPGFYGRIDIGDYVPRPVVYAPQPVIIAPAPHYVAEPVYLRVPPGHRKHWARYCGRYGACGRPVLFVRDEWYTNTYVPRYREHVGYRGDYRGGPREVRVVERVEYRDDRGHGGDWDRGHGNGHGHGHGHGNGHGKGHGHGHD
jgi:hypothetical protein